MLTIAVLHYNRDDLTNDCVDSIRQQSFNGVDPYHLFVLDNGSPSAYHNPTVDIKRIPKNVGNIAGQNECFKMAEDEWVLFVSNDVRMEPGCLQRLWMHGEHNKQSMPLILNADKTVQSMGGRIVWPGYGINLTSPQKEGIDYIPSICYLMEKNLWYAMGGFDEKLPMAYEDADMGLKLGNNRLKQVLEAHVIHLGNATLQYTRKDRWRFQQGRLRLVRKHYRGLNRWIREITLNLAHLLG